MQEKTLEKEKQWKRSYTWLLLANAAYILLFVIIMLIFG